jgi:hypothetical protein
MVGFWWRYYMMEGLYCNIPLVSNESFICQMCREASVYRIHYDGESFITQSQLNTGLTISVRIIMFKTKGHKGIFTQGVYKWVWAKNIHLCWNFLSLGLRIQAPLLLLSTHRLLPLSRHDCVLARSKYWCELEYNSLFSETIKKIGFWCELEVEIRSLACNRIGRLERVQNH